MMTVVGRRNLLLAAPALALSCAGPARALGTPFPLGVASGEPTPSGVVLWTRLAAEPLATGPVEVAWTVAEDAAFTRVVRQGREIAVAEEAHSVHAEVEGLRPGRPYFYRFTALGDPESLRYAYEHAEVIERYGRFPSRNAALGRASAPDEEASLSQPNAGW